MSCNGYLPCTPVSDRCLAGFDALQLIPFLTLNMMNMKKRTSLFLLLSAGLLSATPALAAEHYISGSIGIPSYQDMNSSFSFYDSPAANLVRDTKISLNSGILLFGAAGVNYGNVRIEGELGYQTFNFDKIRVHSEGTGNTQNNPLSVYVYDTSNGAFNETSSFNLAGKGSVTSLLANAYYDIPVGGGVKPYVTAGAGVAQIRYVGFGVYDLPNPAGSNELNRSNADTMAFAYQLGAGISVPVSNTVTLDARYRYFATAHYDLLVYEDTTFKNHQFLVSARVGI